MSSITDTDSSPVCNIILHAVAVLHTREEEKRSWPDERTPQPDLKLGRQPVCYGRRARTPASVSCLTKHIIGSDPFNTAQ
jgi:hypothetical protein